MHSFRPRSPDELELGLKSRPKAVRLVEIRADRAAPWFDRVRQASRSLRATGVETILCVRAAFEGGEFPGTETDREALLRSAVTDFDWLDVEARAQFVATSFAPARKLVSWHDYNGVPADLDAVIAQSRAVQGKDDRLKVAVTPSRLEDLQRFLERTRAEDGVFLAMGRWSGPIRAQAGRLGARWVYGHAAPLAPTAHGQIDSSSLAELYRVQDQHADWAASAVVGNPLGHSLSPLLHNRGYRSLELDRVMIPLEVESFADAEAFAAMLGLDSMAVTMPFKEDARSAARDWHPRTSAAERRGSCNTLLFRDGEWWAANTDVQGIEAALRADLPRRPRAVVLGAGGAARTALSVLLAAGCPTAVSARRAAAAESLAAEFGADTVRWDDDSLRTFELVINTTPVGLAPDSSRSPVGERALRAGQVVFDMIYRPLQTELLRLAELAGASTRSGATMFLHQALRQFQWMTGYTPPETPMAEALERALS